MSGAGPPQDTEAASAPAVLRPPDARRTAMRRSWLRAVPTLLRVGLADAVAYRAEFFIWILATNMPLVMLALWNAVAREHPIGQWGQQQFVAYFLTTLVVRLLTGSWVVWEMNYELRQGLLAFRMLRPIHPLVHYAAENLSALPVRGLFALPIAAISLYAMGPQAISHDPLNLAVFVIGVAGAWVLTFLVMAIIGVLGFFLESSVALFQVWFGLFMLLSGYLIPLSLFPPWLEPIARVLPFHFMLSFPVETLLGHFSRGRVLLELGAQWAFIALFGAILAAVWRAGVRRFNAYGG